MINTDHIFDSVVSSYRTSLEGLALFRIFYALFILAIFTPGHASYMKWASLGALPKEVFHPPPGPFSLLSGFPPSILLSAVEFGIILTLLLLLIGYRTRAASFGTSLLFLFGFGISYSVGKVNHNMLFILLPFVMGFSDWGAVWSADAGRRSTGGLRYWPRAILALLTSFAWFTAGLAKLSGGWLDTGSQATQGHLFRQFFIRDRQDLLASYFVDLDAPLFWEVLDYATVMLEVGFLVAFVRIGLMRVFVSSAMIFHLGTVFMMNIAGFAWMVPVYAVFVSWERLPGVNDLVSAVYERVRTLRPWMMAGILLVTALLLFLFGSPFLLLNLWAPFSADMSVLEVSVIFLGTLVGVHYLWGVARDTIHGRRLPQNRS